MSARIESPTLPERVGVATVFGLSWPIMVSMLSRTAMSAADTIFVGRLGTTALAAIGVASIVAFLGFSFSMGLLGGVNVAVAQRTGSGDSEGTRRMFWQAVWMALALGAVVIGFTPFASTLLGWMGTGPEATALASEFLTIRLVWAPVLFLSFGLTSWFQGRGDTRTPMVATLLANGLNIALDPIFIFGWGPVPAMGMPGAAVATDIALLVGLLWLLRGAWGLVGEPVRPQSALLREIWRLGSPLGVWYTLDVIAFVVFVSLLARAGEAHLAAHVLVIRIISVSFLPGHAVGEASGVLVGQALGAGRPELAGQAFRASAKLGVGVMAAFGVVFVVTPELLLRPFGAQPDVLEVGRDLMRIAAFFQVFDALAMVSLGSLKGAGDTRFTMALGVLSAWLVKLPFGIGLASLAGLGAVGAWLGLTIEIVFLAAMGLWRIQSGRWLHASEREERRQLAAK